MTRLYVDAVATIERETFTMPWSRDTFSDLLARPDAECLVATAPGEGLLGYAVYWWAGGEAELGDLAVREPARGRGVGSALIAEVLRGAAGRGAERLFLEVREGNRPARALYRRHGFREAGRRPDYYRDPREDAIVMVRSLRTAPTP
jgi:ribosomal-protein-alanine N-acetyltransferase